MDEQQSVILVIMSVLSDVWKPNWDSKVKTSRL